MAARGRYFMDSCPLLPLAVAFISGILLEAIVNPVAGILTGVAITIILAVVRHNYLSIITATVATGLIVTVASQPAMPPAGVWGKRVLLSGAVTEMTEGESTRNMIVKVDSINGRRVDPFKMFTVSWSFDPEVESGDRLAFYSDPEPVDLSTDLPLEFNYGKFLYHHGVTATALIKARGDVLRIGVEAGLRYSLIRCQSRIVDIIASSGLSPETKTFLITILTGDRRFLIPADREIFAGAGVAHVLALSGLHVAILSFVFTWLLFPLTVMRDNKVRMIITIILLWGYALMTGMTPSVVRSVIMASVLALGRVLERRPSPVNSLSFTAILILLFDPLAIYSIGFQLSFAAVIFILLFAEKLNPVNKRDRLAYNVVAFLTTSFSAAMGTGIVAAACFHSFPVYFLLANIPFTLLLPAVLGGGVVFVLLALAGITIPWLDASLDLLCGCLDNVVNLVARLPGASIDSVYISPCILAMFIIGIAAIALVLYYPRRATAAIAGIVVVGIATCSVVSGSIVDDSSIYFPRHKRYSVMMVPDRPVLRVYTTAYLSDLPELDNLIRRRYTRFMMSRGIDSVEISGIDNAMITVRGRNFIFTRNIPSVVNDDDVVILTRGFKAAYIDSTARLPERVYISPCVHPRSIEKIREKLREFGVQPVEMKEVSIHSDLGLSGD